MVENDWKKLAQRLFFIEKLSIADISDKLNISRRSISAHLNSLDEYHTEKERRKEQTRLNRKNYKRNWTKKKREEIATFAEVTGSSIKAEHIQASITLSREKIYG